MNTNLRCFEKPWSAKHTYRLLCSAATLEYHVTNTKQDINHIIQTRGIVVFVHFVRRLSD